MKLAITIHCGICFNLRESTMTNTVTQNKKLMIIANWPSITKVPVKKGRGITLPLTLFFLLLNSM